MNGSESNKIKVAIVEDNPALRDALCQVIQLCADFELSLTCNNGEEALQQLPTSNAQIVLMDINLGGINGIEVVRQLKQRVPQMQFMMCTVYEDDDKIFDALRAGASGYILKKTPPLQLVDAIGELHQGGSPMTPLIARKVVAAFINTTPLVDSSYPQREDEDLNRLSKREREILEMMASGKPHKDIADELGISPQTVRKHVFNIYEKLHVSNRVEAINKYFGRQ
jgi:DNA-binding NarL/FixJ family response regulator